VRAISTYPIPEADTNGTEYNYNDSVDISGAFETVDTRVPPVWQAVMDLPPGNCTITLSVYEDDEVVCVGSQTLAILEDQTTKYDIVLVCSLSIDTPDGMATSMHVRVHHRQPLSEALRAQRDLSTVAGPEHPLARTEMQYRAKDPDNTWQQLRPQSCTTTNPLHPLRTTRTTRFVTRSPVVTPPARRVWQVAPASSAPLRRFRPRAAPQAARSSPTGQTTPVGPVLPVNLNTQRASRLHPSRPGRPGGQQCR
jgi:hypothetical protein